MAMAGKSRVLVIGATGGVGQHIALAGPAQGHPTFAFVRSSTLSSKASLIHSFKAAGISILEGSVEDRGSLVAALRQVDVVICAVSAPQMLGQLKVIEAIKEVGTIKRFFPSEFGVDVDREEFLEPAKTMFGQQAQVRRAVEAAGIPYTYLVSYCFARYFPANLMQVGVQSPPRDKVSIYGSGDVKFVSVSEEDVGAYVIRAVDDPRTLNKMLHLRPAKNFLTMNSLVELWEKLIGKTLERVSVTEEDFVAKHIQGTPFPENVYPAILHYIVFRGDSRNFELGPKDVDATALYPDHKYISTEELLSKFV